MEKPFSRTVISNTRPKQDSRQPQRDLLHWWMKRPSWSTGSVPNRLHGRLATQPAEIDATLVENVGFQLAQDAQKLMRKLTQDDDFE